MKRSIPSAAFVASAIALTLSCFPSTALVAADAFTAAVKDALAQASPTQSAIPGAVKPWRFVTKELQHLAHGDLAQAAFPAINVEGTDPLPVIAQYGADLKKIGVELLLVPVPPKAAIYPDKLSAQLASDAAPAMKDFLAKITASGVQVLDLEPLFRQHRSAQPEQALYCATDSHWSPLGAELAATAVAKQLASLPALSQRPTTSFTLSATETLEFHGDLLSTEEKGSLPPEQLPLRKVSPATAGPSPILVIGDSHCQVFRTGGNMLASDAGFIDHLASALSTPIEEISSQASGADQPRADIARRTAKDRQFWSSRKVVVWLFTAREFTQGKWRPIPVQVGKK
jgi:alginate O-acetyltransferase complex protein AlgJ